MLTSFHSFSSQDCQIKDGQTESIRMGKDEKIAKEAGIRFNVKVLTDVWCCEFLS